MPSVPLTRTQIYLDQDLIDAYKILSAKENRSMSDLIRETLYTKLKNNPIKSTQPSLKESIQDLADMAGNYGKTNASTACKEWSQTVD